MKIPTTATKARMHIAKFAASRNAKLILNDVLWIFNRHLSLPLLNRYLVSQKVHVFRHLAPFMFPIHSGCFIDIGANYGLWTLFVADKGFEVHAFEPSPQAFSMLQHYTKGCNNVTLHNCGLGKKNGRAKLLLHQASSRNSIVHKGHDYTGKRLDILVRTLDSFGFDNVGLIKIDTEGYEVPVLLGGKKTIISSKPRLIIEVHNPVNEEEQKITAILKRLGYKWIVMFRNQPNRQPHIIAGMP